MGSVSENCVGVFIFFYFISMSYGCFCYLSWGCGMGVWVGGSRGEGKVEIIFKRAKLMGI